MTTLQITADSPEARKFIEFARTLPFVREKKTENKKVFERIPGLAYTNEERIASVRKAVDEHRETGISFSQQEMERWAAGLR